MTDNKFDLIVVGGGPGGYVAAIRASQLGMKTALVEANHLGGICLNWGCIPTKALLRSGEVHHLLKNADEYGFKVNEIEIDFNKIVQRSRDVAKRLSGGVSHLLKKNKVTVYDGFGKLEGKGKLSVKKEGKIIDTISAPHIILATGARARELPGKESDGKLIWTYKEAMVPEEAPKSLLVVGSGAIGIEFASFYNNMGSDVTVVEVIDRILPAEDEEISAFARKEFEKQGIKIHTSAKITNIDKSSNKVTIDIEVGGKAEQITVDKVIMAVGITGNTENIGLENAPGVKVDKGHIVVNEWLQTGETGIYAIGDVVSPPWLAHKASHEGVICVEKIHGMNDVHPLNISNIPGCTYCTPQIASVGLTEKAANDKGYKIKVGKFPFLANGKAIAMGEDQGMVKTIFDAKTGELLGAHMVGAEVTEMIQGYVIGKTLETTEAELMHTIFPHPTLSEMMHESVLDAYGRAIHF
jgi:dihydrolipoamide dehydrogenase